MASVLVLADGGVGTQSDTDVFARIASMLVVLILVGAFAFVVIGLRRLLGLEKKGPGAGGGGRFPGVSGSLGGADEAEPERRGSEGGRSPTLQARRAAPESFLGTISAEGA
jgi:hypothetical protein